LKGLEPTNAPRGDGIGLNFPYIVIIEILTKTYNHSIN